MWKEKKFKPRQPFNRSREKKRGWLRRIRNNKGTKYGSKGVREGLSTESYSFRKRISDQNEVAFDGVFRKGRYWKGVHEK